MSKTKKKAKEKMVVRSAEYADAAQSFIAAMEAVAEPPMESLVRPKPGATEKQIAKAIEKLGAAEEIDEIEKAFEYASRYLDGDVMGYYVALRKELIATDRAIQRVKDDVGMQWMRMSTEARNAQINQQFREITGQTHSWTP